MAILILVSVCVVVMVDLVRTMNAERPPKSPKPSKTVRKYTSEAEKLFDRKHK